MAHLLQEIARYHSVQGLNHIFLLHLARAGAQSAELAPLLRESSGKAVELINRWCWHQYQRSSDPVVPHVPEMLQYQFDRLVQDLRYITGRSENLVSERLKARLANYLAAEAARVRWSGGVTDIALSKATAMNKMTLTTGKGCSYTVSIFYNMYLKLKSKLYRSSPELTPDQADRMIFALYFRYSYLDSGNQQLAVCDRLKELFHGLDVKMELFGSAMNTYCESYCSLFTDLESRFGSHGDFFDFDLPPGRYWCNPPFDDTIMTRAGEKIVERLRSDAPYCFLVTIPVWDAHTQAQTASGEVLRNANADTSPDMHSDFAMYSMLKPFIRHEYVLPKAHFAYFNHRYNRTVYAVASYLLLVHNDAFSDPQLELAFKSLQL